MAFRPQPPASTAVVPTFAYVRVSTNSQSTASQLAEVQKFCELKGWPITQVFSDTLSGCRVQRPGLDQMIREIEANTPLGCRVVVYKLDRIGRSLPHLSKLVEWFTARGCAFICTSQGVDTSADNAIGRLQLGLFMVFAEFERELIRERTKAGLAAARAQGRFGGPKMPEPAVRRMIHDLHAQGQPYRVISKKLGISVNTVMKYVHQPRPPEDQEVLEVVQDKGRLARMLKKVEEDRVAQLSAEKAAEKAQKAIDEAAKAAAAAGVDVSLVIPASTPPLPIAGI